MRRSKAQMHYIRLTLINPVKYHCTMIDSLASISRELSRLERAILTEDAANSPPIPRPLGALSAAVLEHLQTIGVDSPSSIASALGISPPATSRVLRKLASRDFVHIRKSATDRRGRDVELAAAGAEALEVQKLARRDAIERIFDGWSSEEIAVLASSLERLNNRVVVIWRESVSSGEGAARAAEA